MENTKELTNIPELNPEDKVVIKKLGFGSLSILRGKSTSTELDPAKKIGDMRVNIDFGKYIKWLLILGIKEAPFFKDCKNISDREKVVDDDVIPATTGEYIVNKIKELNDFENIEKQKKN